MAKYGSGLCISDICKLEVAEATETLAKYKVSAEDVESITGMIKEAYFQCLELCASARAIEQILKKRGQPEITLDEYMSVRTDVENTFDWSAFCCVDEEAEECTPEVCEYCECDCAVRAPEITQ